MFDNDKEDTKSKTMIIGNLESNLSWSQVKLCSLEIMLIRDNYLIKHPISISYQIITVCFLKATQIKVKRTHVHAD